MKKLQYQQGDVCIETIAALPVGAVKLGNNIVRTGETTGHAHRLVGDGEVFEHKGVKYLAVGTDGAELLHEEHRIHTYKQGVYRVLPGVFEHDYDTEEAKRVID